MKKVIALILTSLLLVTGMTACGKKEAAAPLKYDPNEKVTLRFSWWGGDTRHKATLEAIKAFEAKYPNITVNAEYAGWDGYQDKQTTQISGGTAADIMQINWNWLPIFSKDGSGFYDLNKLSKQLGLDNYTKEMLETGTVNKKLNAIPVSMTGRVLYLNKTTYDKFGVAMPKTWDDLKNAATKFDKGYYPVDLGAYDAWLLSMTYAEQKTNKQFISNDGKLVFTQDDVKTALQFYKDLIDNKVAPTIQVRSSEGGSSTTPVAQLPSYLNGKLAGVFEWTSAIAKDAKPLEQKKMQMVNADVPQLSGAKNTGVILKPSMLLAINKDCKHPVQAAMFLNFILNEPDGVKAMSTERGIPVSKAAEKTLKDAGKLKGLEYDGVQYVTAHPGVAISPYLEDQSLQKVYDDTIEQLSYNKLDVDGAAKYMVENVKKALETLTSK